MITINDKISKNGFSVLYSNNNWKVAFITFAEQYGKMKVVKRHNLTDEIFVLIKGKATLFTSDEKIPNNFTITELQLQKLYNVIKGTWHHLTISDDALLVVVENSNTSNENTDIFHLDKIVDLQ